MEYSKTPIKDKNGNLYYTKVSINGRNIEVTKVFALQEGKSTLKGDYDKLNEYPNCKHSSRLDCNYGFGYERCEFMEYVPPNLLGMGKERLGYWRCKFVRRKKRETIRKLAMKNLRKQDKTIAWKNL